MQQPRTKAELLVSYAVAIKCWHSMIRRKKQTNNCISPLIVVDAHMLQITTHNVWFFSEALKHMDAAAIVLNEDTLKNANRSLRMKCQSRVVSVSVYDVNRCTTDYRSLLWPTSFCLWPMRSEVLAVFLLICFHTLRIFCHLQCKQKFKVGLESFNKRLEKKYKHGIFVFCGFGFNFMTN